MKTFREFVMEQENDRPINQQGGWSDCAVGDYYREEVGKPIPYPPTPDNLGAPWAVFDALNFYHGTTYGELKALFLNAEAEEAQQG